MPQMMPLNWFMLSNFTISLLVIMISFMFFFLSPPTKIYNKKFMKNMINNNKNKNMWIWEW